MMRRSRCHVRRFVRHWPYSASLPDYGIGEGEDYGMGDGVKVKVKTMG